MTAIANPLPWQRLLAHPLLQSLTFPRDVGGVLESLNADWSLGEVKGRLVARHAETADAATLTFQVNSWWQGHRPGQYVELTVDIDGVRQTRCYSVTSAPAGRGGEVSITVKAHDGGQVSNWLVHEAAPGLRVRLSQAKGDFVLPAQPETRLQFVAGGSGITPLWAMLSALETDGYDGEVGLLYYVRQPEDAMLAARLAALAQRWPRLRYQLIATQATTGDWQGHFSGQHLRQLWDGDRFLPPVYVCGPEPLLAGVRQVYEGWDAGYKLHFERFRPPVLNTSGEGEIRLARSQRVIAVGEGTLLERLEAAGVAVPYGCRMGICHTCECQKVAGQVRDARYDTLSESGAERIRLCVSVPNGPVELDL